MVKKKCVFKTIFAGLTLTFMATTLFAVNENKNKNEYLYSNGDKYTGALSQGVKEGQGILVYQKGSILKGQWKNDFLIEGLLYRDSMDENPLTISPDPTRPQLSECTFFKGKSLEGEMRNGGGTLECANGDYFIGTFKEGRLHGNGIYYYKNQGNRCYRSKWEYGEEKTFAGRMYPDCNKNIIEK